MNGISKTNIKYDHSTMTNYPPYITNFPLLEPIERKKQEFKENELAFFKKEYNNDKIEKGFIWTCLIAIPISIALLGRYVYKKSEHVTGKIKAAFKSS